MQGLHGNDQVMTGDRREQNGWIKLSLETFSVRPFLVAISLSPYAARCVTLL